MNANLIQRVTCFWQFIQHHVKCSKKNTPTHTHTYMRTPFLSFFYEPPPSQARAAQVSRQRLPSTPSRQFGFARKSGETSLICVTYTNAFKFPEPQLLTSLIPCNALFTSFSCDSLRPPQHSLAQPSRITGGTAADDSPGRKSIRP